MPLDVDIEGPGRLRVRASGEVTFVEIEQTQKTLLAHEGLRPGADLIVEANEVSAVPSAGELRQAASLLAILRSRGLGATAFVTDNPLVFGVARMFGVFAEALGASVQVFRVGDEAREWLEDQRRDLIAPET
ncbi:MAG TPA: STAS/SEC14 domain-containing protein [Gemmatimonadaceae bacterium]